MTSTHRPGDGDNVAVASTTPKQNAQATKSSDTEPSLGLFMWDMYMINLKYYFEPARGNASNESKQQRP